MLIFNIVVIEAWFQTINPIDQEIGFDGVKRPCGRSSSEIMLSNGISDPLCCPQNLRELVKSDGVPSVCTNTPASLHYLPETWSPLYYRRRESNLLGFWIFLLHRRFGAPVQSVPWQLASFVFRARMKFVTYTSHSPSLGSCFINALICPRFKEYSTDSRFHQKA